MNIKSVLLEFITLYRSLPELWDTNHKDYNNREKKATSYNKLVKKYQEIEPSATRDTVVKKINSIRSTFRKELRKVHESKQTAKSPDDIYKPTVWYYEDLLFLVEDESPESSEPPTSGDMETSDCSEPTLNQGANQAEETVIEFRENTLETLYEPPASKKKKIKNINEMAGAACHFPNKHLRPQEDEFMILAKGYATKLKKMAGMQQLYADRLINEVLLEGQLENLDRDSYIGNTLSSKTTTSFSAESSSSFINNSLLEPKQEDI